MSQKYLVTIHNIEKFIPFVHISDSYLYHNLARLLNKSF